MDVHVQQAGIHALAIVTELETHFNDPVFMAEWVSFTEHGGEQHRRARQGVRQ
jgi:hypothetical protein